VKPLKVAVVTKHSTSRDRETRNMGYWSYPVPEFEWEHVDGLNTRELNGFDLVVQEDAGPRRYGGLIRPLVYVAIDSTLSPDHLLARLDRAKNADLILLDHAPLGDFNSLGIPVRRWNYCVNDHLYKDYGESKTVDVAFHCANSGYEERRHIRTMLEVYCTGAGLTYGSGVMHPTDYARAMARAKIVVNWPKTPTNRPHRVFDAMACGACLVSGPLPEVEGDRRLIGRDYFEVGAIEDLPAVIDDLLEKNDWQRLAENGKRLIAKYHTWQNRAAELREIIREELGL
jgi:glycosyltransferase involved in cell wall biosynthesis